MKATILAIAAVAGAVPATLDTRQSTCSSGVHIIVARGTFEPQGSGLQGSVVSAILSKIPGSDSSDVVYPASFVDISSSLATGVANTQKQINDYVKACPSSKIVLMGYSQGAQVVGDAISGGGTGKPDGGVSNPTTPISQDVGKNVVAVILFGDPNRVKSQGTDNAPNSCTVSASSPRPASNQAAMAFYADRLNEYCDAGDPVCCATGSNIVAHLGYFGPENANAIANYVAEKASNLSGSKAGDEEDNGGFC